MATVFRSMGKPELFLSNAAEINAKDECGQTVLHAAAFHGYKDVAEFLVASGAEVDAKDNEGATPLHYAARNGHRDVAEILRKHGGADMVDKGSLLCGCFLVLTGASLALLFCLMALEESMNSDSVGGVLVVVAALVTIVITGLGFFTTRQPRQSGIWYVFVCGAIPGIPLVLGWKAIHAGLPKNVSFQSDLPAHEEARFA